LGFIRVLEVGSVTCLKTSLLARLLGLFKTREDRIKNLQFNLLGDRVESKVFEIVR